MCNCIQSYITHFGLPHIFLTLNPAPHHSPIFQFIYGDESVNLNLQFPMMPNSFEQSIRVAKDLVATADFFKFVVERFFTDLLGWDFHTQSSTDEGGILGHIECFTGTLEFTERGNLHSHFLIWLLGSLNPSDTHNRLKIDTTFRDRYFVFWDSIINHDLPDIEYNSSPNREPCIECPAQPPNVVPTNAVACQQWNSIFILMLN